MEDRNRTYIAIDLKSFYASVECVERGLDPMTTNLVVADNSRTEKTICLAVSPSLKAYGISGRARLFEVVQKVREIKAERGEDIEYIVALPRMALYMEYSTKIYKIYLKYAAPEDMHVYSIDEIFIDVTQYLNTYKLNARELARKIVMDVFDTTGITATAGIGDNLYLCKVAMDIVAKHIKPDLNARELARKIVMDVFDTTGITATAGIGDNLYLCKVAMDIVAKHIKPDQYGVRIAKLDEKMYRKLLWNHKPITDFWRVGRGYAKKLEEYGMYTMGDVARCSIGKPEDFHNEELLYRLFGINAELLIDHAWGWEPCTMADIKKYKPVSNSIGSGQVLHCPYSYEKGRLIVREMTDLLVLDLVDKGLVTDQIVMTIGYDIENLQNSVKNRYTGEVTTDHYGRCVPKHAHGTANLSVHTSSTKRIMEVVLKLYDQIVNPHLTIRRVYLSANHVVDKTAIKEKGNYEQLDLFTDYEAILKEREAKKREDIKEEKIQKAVLTIKKRYGKNAILKGMNLVEGAMTRERNEQIGGHRA